MDAAQREEILTRYREHSRRFQTVAARRNPAVDLIEFPTRPAGPEPEHLPTAREIEVLQLIAWGNGAGAAVRTHMRNILRKLGATDRAHAVTIAVTRGILRLGDAQWRAAHA